MLVSALLLREGKPHRSLVLALERGKVLISFQVLAELHEGLGRDKFRRYVEEEEVHKFLAALTRDAQLVDVEVQIAACRDPKDDKILELAVSGNATHIVTGDDDLLVLDPFRGISIVTPNRFLESLSV